MQKITLITVHGVKSLHFPVDINVNRDLDIYRRFFQIKYKTKSVFFTLTKDLAMYRELYLIMITGKINLATLKHVEMEVEGQKGKVKGMFIPYDINHIFQSDKGTRNLDILCFEMKEKKDYATHIVKQSLPKDVREKMTEEQKKEMPIIGQINMDTQVGGEVSSNVSADTTFTPTDKIPF